MPGYTTDDLATRVLTRLGEVGFGQQQEPEARRRVTDALPGLLQEFEGLGWYDFATSADVPGAAMDSLSAIVASRLSDDFGLAAEQAALLAQRAEGAGQRLLRLKFQAYSGWRPRRSTYY